MKFVFPQNYDSNSKILGIIDYSAAILNVCWSGFVFIILKILLKNLYIKISLFIILVFPILIFSIVGIAGENIIYVINYLIKYIFSPKIFLYNKQEY